MTPQQIEAMKLALEALYPIAHNTTDDPRGQAYKAITALEEVLAQPEQEPVIDKSAAIRIATSLGWTPQRTEQEPVGTVKDLFTQAAWERLDVPGSTKVYLDIPPQRKPLTEKRIEELYSFWVVDCQDIVGFARAVERTVKGEV